MSPAPPGQSLDMRSFAIGCYSVCRVFHSEIDQVFSRVSVGLHKRNAATRTLLGEGILASYMRGRSNFDVFLEHLNNLGNVRDLVKDVMFPLYLVTKPQAFKVAKDPADGEVRMQVQARSYNQDWGVINRCGCAV